MNKYLPLVSVAILLCSNAALAGSPKAPYIGAGVGINTSVDDNDLSTTCGVGGVACREVCDTDKAVNAYAGYPLSPNLGVEIGYTDMDYTARIEQEGGAVRGDQQSKALTLSAVGRKPLTQNVGVFGKVGAAYWKSEVVSTAGNADDSGVTPTLGAGVEYNFSEHFGVRAGVDHFFKMGEQSKLIESGVVGTADTGITTATVGLHYNF
ncbi:OmpA-like transmembrane domain-containing protein [Thiothrix caldifontis]|jgi:OmpA-like transmembrane domain.|uniref:OmpA-like transmembrane domain-containing protein n=1 Tax=Thiothrix caldifontis TaxID=525918 RepID=A0A1H3Z560_9GAMM|nr:outer membrane beta-barrel protein [Thiothrix caldifontis]SEA18524.1 OmpA-like transmembrane domain-containing protein [Thiothrix caldifontis]